MYTLRTKLLQGTVSDLKAKTSNHDSLKQLNFLFMSHCPHAGNYLNLHCFHGPASKSIPCLHSEEEQTFHPYSCTTGAARHWGGTHAKRPRLSSQTIYYFSHFCFSGFVCLFVFQVRSWWFFLRYTALVAIGFMTVT